jgi:hypothetical protein
MIIIIVWIKYLLMGKWVFLNLQTMIRKITWILLLCTLSIPLLYKSFVVVRYYVYFDYYAEVLCENKDVPMSHCNGQCALMKELNAARDSKESAESPMGWMKDFSVSVFEPSLIQEQFFSWEVDYFHFSHYVKPRSDFFRFVLDQPPCWM